MKTKNLLSVFVLVIISCCFAFVGCGSKPIKPVATLNGFQFQQIKIVEDDDEFYIKMKIKNTNTIDASFDFSDLVLKIDDEASISHLGDVINFEAGEVKELLFELVSVPSEFSEGDVILIYYNAEIAGTFEVNEY